MRSPRTRLSRGAFALLTVVVLAATALAGSPAQAAPRAGGPFLVGWDGTSFTVTATPGMTFAPEEELQIIGTTGFSVRMTVVGGDHTFTADGTANCHYDDGLFDMECAWTSRPANGMRVTVNLASAVGSTTTVMMTPARYPVALDFTGGPGSDYVQGGPAADVIRGGGSRDDLFGGAGDDQISGDDGNDLIDGEEGADTVGGGPGDDNITGGPDPDRITGGTGVNSVDAADDIADTYVSCDNAPGQGSIDFDRGLDIPYDCPVVLPPTQPLSPIADGGPDSVTLSWTPPDFDGNAPLTYEMRYRAPGTKDWSDIVPVDGTETSYTVTDLSVTGGYVLSLRAVNEAGASPWTTGVTAIVGQTPPAPTKVQSIFRKRWSASLSWKAPDDATGFRYEIALRVKNARNTSWLAWRTLPDRVRDTSLDVGDDLRIVQNRVYQFRVRTVGAAGLTSGWVTSPLRYAGDLLPLRDAVLRPTPDVMRASVTTEGLAWKYNVKILNLLAAYRPGEYAGLKLDFVSVSGSTYTGNFPLTGPYRTKNCNVGIAYSLPDGQQTSITWAAVGCPS